MQIHVICFRVKREEQCKELKAELAKLGQKYFTMYICQIEGFHECISRSHYLGLMKKKINFMCYYFRVKRDDSLKDLKEKYDDLGQKHFTLTYL